MAYNLLKGKKGIIFGVLNDQSIAWKVAEKAHEEGAVFTLSNTPVALRLGTLNELGKRTNSLVIPADATSVRDIENVFGKTMEIFGGKVDFIEIAKPLMILVACPVLEERASAFTEPWDFDVKYSVIATIPKVTAKPTSAA